MLKAVSFAAIWTLAPALAWAATATAPSGVKTQIVVHNSADSECNSRTIDIKLVAPPSNGTVVVEPKDVVIQPVTPRGGEQPSRCVGKTLPGVAVFYQSAPGFVGTDTFRYRRVANDRSDGEINYTITVVAAQGQAPVTLDAPPPPVRMPAAAPVQAPAPAAVAQAEGPAGTSIKAIFEKYDLIGTFAWDCTQPPDRMTNWYNVNRVIDADHIQRDFMETSTSRLWVAILDKARETAPGEIFLSGTRDGKYVDGVWRIDKGHVLVWAASQDGKKLVENGRYLVTGKDLRSFTKCGAPSTAAVTQAQPQPAAQPSPPGPIGSLFDKYGLIGIFAADCSKPVGNDNKYFVNRAIDADHVQRDEMSGPTIRDHVSILDKASVLGPSEVSVAGMRDGQPIESTWRLEGSRQIGTEVTLGGKKVITNARYVNGSEVPWLNKCGG